VFLDDLLVLLQTAGVGTPGTNIFASSKSVIPVGPGPYLSVTETGGSGPEGTHNAVGLPAYQRPNAQLLVRASTYAAARTMAYNAYAACVAIGQRSQLVNGVWYRSIIILQEPFDMGVESGTGRAVVAFNIAVVKRPNVEMSGSVSIWIAPGWVAPGWTS
jgi:hypothetical protein